MKHRIIPIFIPNMGCPSLCVYCDQKQQTGENCGKAIAQISISSIVSTWMPTFKDNVTHVEIGFFGGTFTGLDPDLQEKFLQEAASVMKRYPRIKGIRLSTHPLTINSSTIKLLKPYPISVVELGIQSLDDNVLKKSGRNYTAQQALKVCSFLKENSFAVGIQLMTGLPFDSPLISYESARKASEVHPVCIRIYPAIVFKNTPLEKMYLENIYTPQKLEEAVSLVKKMLLLFKAKGIPVIRAGIHPVKSQDSILAGPYHPAFRSLCEQNLRLDLLKIILNKKYTKAVVRCSKNEESYFRGIKNHNILLLRKLFPGKNIQIESGNFRQPEVILDEVHHFPLPMKRLKSLYEQALNVK